MHRRGGGRQPLQVLRANDVWIHYRRKTTGGPGTAATTLVLVNSLGTDLRLWDAVVAALPAGLDVVRYDKRGHGLSEATAPPYTIAGLADDLAGLLDGLGVERAVVGGISVGGMIALSLALRRPELVAGLALMDTGHRIGTAEHWNGRIAAVERDGLAPLADNIIEGWLSERFRAESPGEASAWRNLVARTPSVAGYTGVCAALREADLGDEVARIAAPALCLCGADDASTPPALVRELAGLLPRARYAEVAGARHLPCIEQPEAVAAHVAALVTEAAHG